MAAVVSHISNGLGNQLFQFAAGYGLAQHLGCNLDLDVSSFQQAPKYGPQRDLRLVEIVSPHSYRDLLDYSSLRHLSDRTKRLLAFSLAKPYRHGVPMWRPFGRHYVPLSKISYAVCIFGVPLWQDVLENYRREVLNLVSEGLSKAAKVVPPDQSYAFVHVRLGDFVSNPNVSPNMIQLFSTGYYREAMRHFESRHGKSRWILLSDEPENALTHLPPGFSVELSQGQSEIDDLFLMSRSAGGVIANSTFSFWGGLLADHNDSNIVAPSRWRNDMRSPPKLPATWIQL